VLMAAGIDLGTVGTDGTELALVAALKLRRVGDSGPVSISVEIASSRSVQCLLFSLRCPISPNVDHVHCRCKKKENILTLTFGNSRCSRVDSAPQYLVFLF
jgi:hypothetical protein